MSDFSRLINKWYRQNKRDLPWRNTNDPYLIWISEIILQQTRVDQGLNYYLKFKNKYPTVTDLANAEEMDILNDWQGLGYYSRARNLHSSARTIRDQYQGVFPKKYDEIKQLKGIGNYTAAAISSFAFDEVKAVVDGNVYRLLSRVFDVELPIDSTEGTKFFQELADELIDAEHPGTHNQAVMELGALVCTPSNPDCTNCPIHIMCLSLKNNTIAQRPVKKKKGKVRNRYFHFLIYVDDSSVLIEKRTSNDIWKNLYQFPLIEIEHADTDLSDRLNEQVRESTEIVHLLSHQKIIAQFHHFSHMPNNSGNTWLKIEKSDLQNYPLPRLIDRYLENHEL